MSAAIAPMQVSGLADDHTRPLALNIFPDERSVRPSKSACRSWCDVVQLLQVRATRPQKSGPMLGAYELKAAARSNDNVVHRSLIQLDIDTAVERDEGGGASRIVRQAPDLAIISNAIREFEWVATSSHSHEPGRGLIKYRLTMLPDRDILPLEHQPILEALDELLDGCLDRAAWPLSQAFFLSSCPSETASDAFCVHNVGRALPVDKLVARGRDIINLRASLPTQSVNPVLRPQLPETAENVERVRTMMQAVSPALGRAEWRNVVWALASTGWNCANQLAREWSKACPDKWNENDFDRVWADFNAAHHSKVGIGTLEHIARANGWSGQSVGGPDSFNGRGKDQFNGREFAGLWRRKLLFVHEVGEWLAFRDHVGWVAAEPFEEMAAAKGVLNQLKSRAVQRINGGTDDGTGQNLIRHLEYTARAPSLHAMIEMAKSEPGMTVRGRDFDADPLMLGVQNGVLDLRTGTLRNVSPELLVSKRCRVSYDGAATCPRFQGFLGEVQPDPELRAFLQRLVGYCLTGLTSEQVFVFLHGSGGNGKTVFQELLAWLLGDYATKIATELLMQHRRSPQGASPDIVALKGARLAYAAETEEGQRLAAARVKEMTGGDTLSGRVPYAKNAVSFAPTHKLIVVGNHRPEISDMSAGMWRRVLLVGFDQTIAPGRRDSHLLAKLQAEGSGILNWALLGLQQWRKTGLQVPSSITRATAAYRADEDIVGQWVDERCQVGAGCHGLKTSLYTSYEGWAQLNGYLPLARARLFKRLRERGVTTQPDKRSVAGIALKGP